MIWPLFVRIVIGASRDGVKTIDALRREALRYKTKTVVFLAFWKNLLWSATRVAEHVFAPNPSLRSWHVTILRLLAFPAGDAADGSLVATTLLGVAPAFGWPTLVCTCPLAPAANILVAGGDRQLVL